MSKNPRKKRKGFLLFIMTSKTKGNLNENLTEKSDQRTREIQGKS